VVKLLTNGYVVSLRQNETDRRKDTRIGLAAGLSVIAICALRCCNLYLDYHRVGLRLLMVIAALMLWEELLLMQVNKSCNLILHCNPSSIVTDVRDSDCNCNFVVVSFQ